MHTATLNNTKTIFDNLNYIITHDQAIVIGVSGGPDSMYLLHQLKTFWEQKSYQNKNLHIVSCNHGTRDNIHKEIETVYHYSKNYSFYSYGYLGSDYREETLRAWRHHCFVEYCQQHESKILLLGHHLNDRIESSILNIQRGCGTEGLLTMKYSDRHFLDHTLTIVRPLLYCSKDYIIKQCIEHHIPFHYDESNEDIDISQRNKIRKEVMGFLYNGNSIKSIARIYHTLDSYNNGQDPLQTMPFYTSNGKTCVGIGAGERTADKLYQIYRYYHITINPRSSTLTRLSQQLTQSGKSISYKGIHITSYRYVSTISLINHKEI